LVRRLSRIKAQAVAGLLPTLALLANKTEAQAAIIIAADTVVVSQNKILGKPHNPTQAGQMLRELRRQRSHYVYSGLTVGAWPKTETGEPLSKSQPLTLITHLDQTTVWMRPYTDAEIDAYVASGDPLDKAGAYGIQNKSFAPVERLEGCFTSVMGLPLANVAAALREIGLSVPPVGPRCSQYTGHPCCQQ
jgi:MAF protein